MATIPEPLRPLRRKAWKPIVTDGDGMLTASKFSGKPWLAQGESWPTCQNCNQPMQLFIQLNLDDLLHAAKDEFGGGLLQMFYCTSVAPCCEINCQAFFPFAKSTLIRVVHAMESHADFDIPEIDGRFPAKTIIGWQEVDDYPISEEAGEHGIELSEQEEDAWCEEEFPLSGDKLAGWPQWIQAIEYPNCPVCDERMRLVFQIDSEDNLPYMFGDAGCGHITQCETHKSQLAFGWACA